MQYSQFQKAINLAKKTGDRVIVLDSARPDSAYVVMSLNEYEKLILGGSDIRNLTEDQLIDKINRDIALWKSENDLGAFSAKETNLSSYGYEGEADMKKSNIIEDMYRNDLSSPGLRDMTKSLGKKADSKSHWSIPRERKQAAEEVISDEEDKQYLEEITF